jgi:hypothetical protein
MAFYYDEIARKDLRASMGGTSKEKIYIIVHLLYYITASSRIFSKLLSVQIF